MGIDEVYKAERKRLEKWAKGLSEKQMLKTCVDCIILLDMAGLVVFNTDTTVPYYSNTGERLDGSVDSEESENNE